MESICDNCEKANDLTDINYATKRNKSRLLLCPECFDNFALLVIQLVEDRRAEREKASESLGRMKRLHTKLQDVEQTDGEPKPEKPDICNCRDCGGIFRKKVK